MKTNIRKIDDTLMSQLGDKVNTVKEYVEDKVDAATDLYENGTDQARYMMRETRSTIKKYPLASVAVAALGGWFLGKLFK